LFNGGTKRSLRYFLISILSIDIMYKGDRITPWLDKLLKLAGLVPTGQLEDFSEDAVTPPAGAVADNERFL
jgi:hypothetical protein